MKNIGMTKEIYNLIVDNLHYLELDLKNGVILNRNSNSLSKGYKQLGIKRKKVFQHQIFAVARWGERCVGMTVNHKNEIKIDNSWDNLELLSLSDNCKVKTMKTCRFPIVPIKAINIDTGEEFVFESQGEAAKQLGLNKTSIFRNLKGERNRVGRYTFERITA